MQYRLKQLPEAVETNLEVSRDLIALDGDKEKSQPIKMEGDEEVAVPKNPTRVPPWRVDGDVEAKTQKKRRWKLSSTSTFDSAPELPRALSIRANVKLLTSANVCVETFLRWHLGSLCVLVP